MFVFLSQHVSICTTEVTEDENNGTVILSCSVLEYDPCTHTVQWIYEGEKKSSDMQISPPGCTATVTFTTSHLNQKFFESLKCNVMNMNNGKVQLFPFSRQSSGGTTGENINFNNTITQNRNITPVFVMTVVKITKFVLSEHTLLFKFVYLFRWGWIIRWR